MLICPFNTHYTLEDLFSFSIFPHFSRAFTVNLTLVASLKSALVNFVLFWLSINIFFVVRSVSYRTGAERQQRLEIPAVTFPICTCLEMSLHTAVENGDLDRVRLLVVEQGADKDKGNSDGNTPLLIASGHGHLDVVQYLVEQGASLDKANDSGWTPLISAASSGHLKVARSLLEQGADRDKADNDGWTPLHCAAQQGCLETAKLLMSYGADLNARTDYGGLPIDVAYTEEMKQAIRDEPRRRMDHGHKRATEQDRHPNVAASASAQQEEEDEDEEEDKKRPRLDEGVVAEEEAKVAEEDEDSEPSSDEEEDDK